MADISCTPPVLSPGTHTPAVSVTTASSGTSTFSWSFSVDTQPVIGALAPASGAKVSSLTPAISASVTDNDPTFTATMLLDGAPVSPVFSAQTKTYTYTPALPLSDWSAHTVSLCVTDPHGLSTTKAWTFTTHMAPKLTSPTPAAGASATTNRPAIGLTTADDVAGSLQMRLAVDGAVVFTGPVAQGAWSFTPAADLPIKSHSARADVTDAAGNTTSLSWTFVSPIMTAPACAERHVGYPVPNHVVGSCESCHGPEGSGGCGHGESGSCHAGHGSDPSYLVGSNCTSCHSHTASDEAAHHATSTTGCSDCHESSLIIEHSKYPSGSATKFGCVICHASTDPKVVSAIAGNKTNCDACHSLATGHQSLHDTVIDATCAGCHNANLSTQHSDNCGLCHESANPTVTGAIASGSTSCGACHPALHADQPARHTATLTSARIVIFDNHVGNGEVSSEVACSSCHSTRLDVAHRRCDTCHTTGGPLGSFATWNGTCQQGACHPTLHAEAVGSHTSVAASGCDSCHDPSHSLPATGCTECHTAAEMIPPTTVSDAVPSYIGGASISLTATDVRPTSGVHRTYYRLDGAAAVSGTTVSIPAPPTGSQSHVLEFWSEDNSGNVEATHGTAAFTVSADTHAPVTTSDAKATYSGVATIRLVATDDGSIPVRGTYYRLDGGVPTTGTVVPVPNPSAGPPSHTLEFWSVDGSGNEEIPHKLATFTVSGDTAAPVTTCDAPSYDRTTTTLVVHLTASDGPLGSGVSQTFYRLNGGTAYPVTSLSIAAQGTHVIEFWSVDNSGNEELPHKSVTVVKDWSAPVTTSDAQSSYTGQATIHLTPADSGPAGISATFYKLDGEPQSSGTSLTVAANGGHALQFWSVDKAGNTEAIKTVTFSVEGAGADTAPPTTTFDGVASYSHDAEIRLTATDGGGSGVAATYYRVDDGAQAAGTVVRVLAPASGTATHTIEFWSVDNAGNEELPHHTATFVITHTIGTVIFRWDNPPLGAWADFYVDERQVGHGEMPGWNGSFSIDLATRVTPYSLKAFWFDPDNEADPCWSYGSALVDVAGKTVTWYY